VIALRSSREIARDTSGVAMIEFAFAAPLLLTLIFGGVEVANYALAHLRVSEIAVTVADNAGRVPTGIDESNIYEVFDGAATIGESIDFEANGRVILSSLEHNGRTGGNEGQVINWQRCWGSLEQQSRYGLENFGETSAALEDGMGPVGNRITSIEGTAVMFAEVVYDYQPLLQFGIFEPNQIRYESAFNVRGRVANDITNANSLARMVCGG
jgi:hypothetical protein